MSIHTKNLGTLRGARRVGTPYHGIVTGGKLTLPDARQIDYQQPGWISGSSGVARAGSTRYMKSPFAIDSVYADESSRQADLARGVEWKNYNLLTGKHMDIAGQSLGVDHWVYVDGNANRWLLNIEVALEPKPPESDSFIAEYLNIKVTLKQRFGHFRSDGGQESAIDREIKDENLATIPDGNPFRESEWDEYNFFRIFGGGLLIEPSPDGATVLLHWYWDTHIGFQQPSGPWFIFDNHDLSFPTYWGRPIQLAYVWKIQITGDGLIPDDPGQGNLGDNINASIINYFNGTTEETGRTMCVHPTYGKMLRIVYDSDGNEVFYTFELAGAISHTPKGEAYRNGVLMGSSDTEGAQGTPIDAAWVLMCNNIMGAVQKFGGPLGSDPCTGARFFNLFGPEGPVSSFDLYRAQDLGQNWFQSVQATFDWDSKEVIAAESASSMCFV